jgi:molecular chaperone GrpE
MTEENGGKKTEDEIEFITEDEPETAAPSEGEAARHAEAGKERTPKEHPPSEGSRGLRDKLKKKEAELKHLKKEIDELKDQCLRRMADVENLRKRFEREKSDFQQFALSGLLLELLAIKDNLERALQSQSAGPDGRTFREGVELIDRMFQALLSKNGVQPVEISEKRFDPNFHHAMMTEESDDVEEPEVLEELQKGYLHHSRLLRPALVKVAIPKKG